MLILSEDAMNNLKMLKQTYERMLYLFPARSIPQDFLQCQWVLTISTNRVYILKLQA
jgi:hypothetical protein